MKSPKWDDRLFNKRRDYIDGKDALAAFDYLVNAAIQLPNYECGPAPQGAVKTFAYWHSVSKSRDFAFTAGKNHLRFYVRSSGLKSVRGGYKVLKDQFTNAEDLTDEWAVNIRSAPEARRLHSLIFGVNFGDTAGDSIATQDVPGTISSESHAIGLEEDLAAIAADPTAATMRETLVGARIGQGAYRARVLGLWDGQCCVTGARTLSAVRASHIKPWRDCTNAERLDPYNGLPLVGTLDALFDAFLITFSESGELEISSSISSVERAALNLVGLRMKKAPLPKTIEYLRWHRQRVQ
jgi:HNH endonuclease